MFKFVREKVLKSKRGGNEIIGFVLILIFVLLVTATPVKDIGKTTSGGIADLNEELETQLNFR